MLHQDFSASIWGIIQLATLMLRELWTQSVQLTLTTLTLAASVVNVSSARASIHDQPEGLSYSNSVEQSEATNDSFMAISGDHELDAVRIAQVIYYPYVLPLDGVLSDRVNTIGGPAGDVPETEITEHQPASHAEANDGAGPIPPHEDNSARTSSPTLSEHQVEGSEPTPDTQATTISETQRAMPQSTAVVPASPELLLDESNHLSQVASVADLSDVTPNDWAFAALQQLVETYDCLKGFPDGTFRGQQSFSRFEFAAALNTCFTNFLATYGVAPSADLEMLQAIQKLNEEFNQELSQLENRVDVLEAAQAELAAQQFSTTIKLYGEAIFGLAFAEGGNPPGRGSGNLIMGYSSQLGLVGSFTGTDLLRISLTAGNFDGRTFLRPESLNTYMALTSFQTATDDQLQLSALEYRFAGFDDQVVFTLKPVGFSMSSVLSSNSPYASSGVGAVSRFGTESPLFKLGSLDSGAGFDALLTNRVRLQFGYGTRNGSDPSIGVFGGSHRVLGTQLLLNPVNELRLGLAYFNGFSEDGQLDTFTGSFNADTSGTFGEPSVIHGVNATLQWQFGDFLLSGWGGVSYTDSLRSEARAVSTTYLGALGVRDLLGDGDMLTFMVGQPPKLNFGTSIERLDVATALHFETFYRLPVTNRLFLTPGAYLVVNPGHRQENNTIFVGTLRMTLRF